MGRAGTIEAAGLTIPTHSFEAIIIGSGAAGLNCAEHLHELGVTDIAIITTKLGGGTSANSGSDKQTYYKMGVFGDVPDSPMEFAGSLTAGGMCHGDLAYIEALGSLPEFFHLVRNGVQFPHNKYGAYVGYKTDHDPRQRATSAGPKTSMQMVEHSLSNVRRNGTPIFDGFEVVRLLTDGAEVAAGSRSYDKGGAEVAALRLRSGQAGSRSYEERGRSALQSATSRSCHPSPVTCRLIGALAIDKSRIHEDSFGLVAFLADNIVLATGGPGDMYGTSVYPPGQVGSHGLGLEVGCAASNLTESQFGLASVGFRWNLSGTYQQVIPCYFSTDESGGDVRCFLNEYFRTMRQEAANIFLKGYQWPFHAERLQDFGSSLVDIAVFNETRAGRKVYMDFTRNPVATGGLEEFSLEDLEPEARQYLERSGALQDTPYERLEHMNPAAIEIYAEHDVDLREPLEVAVCAQHCNGGLTVDLWWRTNVGGLFAIGEIAGTHGVRPGGSALNAGQVGGLRAAQYIAWESSGGRSVGAGSASHNSLNTTPVASDQDVVSQIAAEIAEMQLYLDAHASAPGVGEVRREIQERMSEHAAFVRSQDGVAKALEDARELAARLAALGQRLDRREQLTIAIQNEHLCRTHIAFLVAMRALIERGGGSRGAYVVLDEDGDRVVETKRGTEMPHRSENLAMRQEILEVQLGEDGEFAVSVTPVRPLPDDDSWYENTWREWREGKVFGG